MVKKMLALLLVLAVTCVGLPMIAISATAPGKNYIIWEAEPARYATDGSLQEVSGDMWGVSPRKTYAVVKEDESYYTTNDFNGSGQASWFNPMCHLGYSGAEFALIRDYITLSYRVRITNRGSSSATSASIAIDAINPYLSMGLGQWNSETVTVPVDGEWHTVTAAVLEGENPSASWSNGRMRYALTSLTGSVPDGITLDIGKIHMTVNSNDAEAIDAALAGTSRSYESLISFVPYTRPASDHVIWEAEPARYTTDGALQQVSGDMWGVSPRKTYAVIRTKDSYYTSEDFNAGGQASWFNPMCNLGYTGAEFALIRDYITLSYRVRVTNKGSSSATQASVTIDAINPYLSIGLGQWNSETVTVPVDGKWHTVTAAVLEGENPSASWSNGRMRYVLSSLTGSAPDGITLDIGDIKMSVNSRDEDDIDLALAGTSRSYESLISFVPYTWPELESGANYPIWQAEPARYTSDGTLQEVSSSSWGVSPRKTYAVINDEDSYYTTDDFNAGGQASWFNPMCHLGYSAAELELIRNYITLTYRVRITNNGSSSATAATVMIDAINEYRTIGVGQWNSENKTIPVDGEWHTVTSKVLAGDEAIGWQNGRMRYVLVSLTGSAPDGLTFDIGGIQMTVNSNDAELINDALVGTGRSYESLISFVPYARPDTVIWYSNPETAKKFMGKDDLTVRTAHWSESQSFLNKYKTYYASDNDGLYFHTEYINGGQGAYNDSLYATGIDMNTPGYGWMANKNIVDILRKYMYLSYQYRVNSDSTVYDGGNVKLCVRLGTSEARIATIKEIYVQGRGDWYEVTPTTINWNVDTTYARDVAWRSGYVGYNFWANDSAAATLDIRNMQFTIPSGLRLYINAELAAVDNIDNIRNFTAGLNIPLDEAGNKDYFSLFGNPYGVENDVNDDGVLNILDLVRAKRIASGVTKFANTAIQKRFSTKMGKLDATALAALYTSLFNQQAAVDTVNVYPAITHPGVVDMDAEYDMCVSDKNGNLLNAADYNWSSNFGSAVTFGGSFSQYANAGTNNYWENQHATITTNSSSQQGIKITVPYSVRMSSKQLVVTAVSKTNGSLSGTYKFNFRMYDTTEKFAEEFDSALDTTEKWKIGHWSGDTRAVAPTVANGEATFTSVDQSAHPQISTQTATISPYGCFSGRIKMSSNCAVTDGLWLVCYEQFVPNPSNPNHMGGELDIYESSPINNRVAHAVHWNGWEANDNDTFKWDSTYYNASFDLTDYHTYSLVWTQDAYYWYVDGVLTKVHNGEGVSTGLSNMYLVYGNNAFSGGDSRDWTGENTTSYVGGSTTVDWIRVYGLEDSIRFN